MDGRGEEFDEIVGYHLEQAYRCLAELGPADERALALAQRAGERLGRTGRPGGLWRWPSLRARTGR